MRYFALKNGFFSRECQIDKSKLQKLQENIITEQKGEKNMLSGLFLRFGTIFGPILANFLGQNIGVWGVQSNAM